MKIELVFDDWRDAKYKSIYRTTEGVELSLSDFHSGTTFEAEIVLDEESEQILRQALANKFHPVFYI